MSVAGQPGKNMSDRTGLVGCESGFAVARVAMPDVIVARVATLTDLQDSRRDKKPWLPADDRDVTNGLVVADEHGKPACVRHGAMNRVDAHRRIYRCSEMYCGVGAELLET